MKRLISATAKTLSAFSIDEQGKLLFNGQPVAHEFKNSEVLDSLATNEDGKLTLNGQPVDRVFENTNVLDALGVNEDGKLTLEGEPVSHTHNNSDILNALSQDENGSLLFNGTSITEHIVEAAHILTLSATQVEQKIIALPDDCDSSRVVTLSLNGVALPRGEFWEVDEREYPKQDLISWEALALENLAQAGDKVIITYYKKV